MQSMCDLIIIKNIMFMFSGMGLHNNLKLLHSILCTATIF